MSSKSIINCHKCACMHKHIRECIIMIFFIGGIGVDGGPPPWIPFGQRLEALTLEKNYKSITEAAKQDNAEFEAQRKGAIAEAQKLSSGVKKVDFLLFY